MYCNHVRCQYRSEQYPQNTATQGCSDTTMLTEHGCLPTLFGPPHLGFYVRFRTFRV